jgi:hypothetical protein
MCCPSETAISHEVSGIGHIGPVGRLLEALSSICGQARCWSTRSAHYLPDRANAITLVRDRLLFSVAMRNRLRMRGSIQNRLLPSGCATERELSASDSVRSCTGMPPIA